MAFAADQRADLQAQLQLAVIACSERCLYHAAKWAAELLNSLPDSDQLTTADDSDTDVDDDNDTPSTLHTTNHDRKEARLETKELPRYLLAKSLFDSREYDRCAEVFLPQPIPHSTPMSQIVSPSKAQTTPKMKQTASPFVPRKRRDGTGIAAKKLSQKALFLGLYARYLSGEKRRNEDCETVLGPADGPATSNKEIPGILAILEEYFQARGGVQDVSNSQGWLDYLYGLCLHKSNSDNLAKQWLLRSVELNPYNWSAWLELAAAISSLDELQQISQHLPQNIMAFFFHIYCNQELFMPTAEVFATLSRMQAYFPSSAFLAEQKALLYYHSKAYETAMQHFDSLVSDHPLRLDGLDHYSNLLYVMPNQAKLATLAAVASDTDKFRPETNCILGNYYSQRSEHEKAILHFRRALTLDRSFTSAWTLMGHEYIELKNLQAAIESYRRAIDINRKDYRAWYGLGQGYEMLECHSYSLFYYQRSAALFPTDPKMWVAVANAYARCGKVPNAIQAYKRALVVGSQSDPSSSFGSSNTQDPLAHVVGGVLDPQVLYDIALLYERESNWEEAAAYMELTLAQEEGAEEGGEGLGVTQLTSRARLWLARWSYSCGEWQRTMELANELCQDGVEVEEAKSLVKDVRARLNLPEQESSMIDDDE